MRILHVYKDYHPVVGGIENHVRSLAEHQAASGHDTTVLVTAPAMRRADEVLRGVRILRAANLGTLASTPLSPDLIVRLSGLRPDITHLHLPYPIAELAWLMVGRRPMVASYHADVVRQRHLMSLWAPGMRALLRRASHVIVGNPQLCTTSPFLHPHAARLEVVPYGVDADRFAPSAERRAAGRRNYRRGMPDGALVLVFVGVHRYYKGIDVLLRAMHRLPESHLLIAGDGPMHEEWRALAGELGLVDRVRWLGRVSEDDLPSVYAAGDVYVLPASARSESYGIAMVEAMAAGLPAISTELGTGTSWVNQDGITGWVVPPLDPSALADALRRMRDDPGRRAEMGRAAMRRAQERLSDDAMNAAIDAVYVRALRDGP